MSTPAVEEQTITEQPTTTEPLRMSYEEFLAYDHEDGLVEWADGEVIIHMTAKPAHQKVVDFLNRLLGLFVLVMKLGTVSSAPVTMRIYSGGKAREPDLFFVANENLARLNDNELSGPADLAIEIISDESANRDRTDKFYEYQEGGVCEYWIIDPRPGTRRVDLYALDATNRYQPIVADAERAYHSVVLPGFWFKEAWLWADEPNPLAALVQIVGTERMIEALRTA